MLHLTDPTYLRYIVDGLHSQSIQQENLAALPQGLIGIYEEALPWEQNIQQRGRFLQFFSVWALLKKEVSAILVSSLLNWPEQEVIDALATHTKWFNSPASGTYILYHERLRTFLLSKITSDQLKQTNQRIIESCQHALELKKGDEWENYALEHLPSHLLITAVQDEEQGASLRKLVYDTSYWNRQVEISKGYDWSKKMLNLAMVWAAKQNTDELIECALNKIDLHYMEQNDAPRIVEQVAQNDIETALQRIESFGGNDKECLQRKFTLYMLCLMELTLLDSKDKPFRKTAIEKLLNHLDENIRIDHTLLKWNDFFPSYLMFLMACEWAEIGLDYLRVYKRTDTWESDWIPENGPYNNLQFDVLFECASIISDGWGKINALTAISKKMVKQGRLEEGESVVQKSLEFARGINNESQKSAILAAISTELVRQGKLVEAIACTRDMTDHKHKINTLVAIFTELSKLGKIEEAALLMQKAFEIACGISVEFKKIDGLTVISKVLAKWGKLEESIEIAYSISNERRKSVALGEISTELSKQGKLEEGALVMQLALEIALGISDESQKTYALRDISTELSKQGKLEESLEIARSLSDELEKIASLASISTVLAKQGKLEESLEIARGISSNYEWLKSNALTAISMEMLKQGQLEESLEIARGISDEIRFGETRVAVSAELAKQGKIEQALEVAREIWNQFYMKKAQTFISTELAKRGKIEESLEIACGISDESGKFHALKVISTELAKMGKLYKGSFVMHESLKIACGISDESGKFHALNVISTELAKKGKLEESLKVAHVIIDEGENSKALVDISTELIKQGKLEVGAFVIQEALESSHSIKDELGKIEILTYISTVLARLGKLEKSLEIVRGIRGISYERQKSSALAAISMELSSQGKLKEASLMMQEALEIARGIKYETSKDLALKVICAELSNQGKMQEAIECSNGISDEYTKGYTLGKISMVLAKQGKLEESLQCARSINPEWVKSNALSAISTELVKHGKIEEGAWVLQEALEFARGISDEKEKNRALISISKELAKTENYISSEQTGLEINQIAKRHDCWKTIANQQKDQLGLAEALINKSKFQSQEAQTYYLKGWAESITVDDISNELAYKAIQALQQDSTSLENFLQVYAQHELFFGNPSQEKIDRLNKTLNLQWALDIIAQFPEE